MSMTEVCAWVSGNVQNTKVREKIIGLILSGHDCRNALDAVITDRPEFKDLTRYIDKYDDVWLE